jgi:hypothetical protein
LPSTVCLCILELDAAVSFIMPGVTISILFILQCIYTAG